MGVTIQKPDYILGIISRNKISLLKCFHILQLIAYGQMYLENVFLVWDQKHQN